LFPLLITVDENICQINFDDDDKEDQQSWIGCDKRGCELCYHHWCAGFFRNAVFSNKIYM